jgi:hypothetical protein
MNTPLVTVQRGDGHLLIIRANGNAHVQRTTLRSMASTPFSSFEELLIEMAETITAISRNSWVSPYLLKQARDYVTATACTCDRTKHLQCWRCLFEYALNHLDAAAATCSCHSANNTTGTTPAVVVPVPGSPSGKQAALDACIADVVQDLWKLGVRTAGSCCGHNDQPPSIAMEGGQNMRVVWDRLKADGRTWIVQVFEPADVASQLSAAFNRSGLDISPCKGCGLDVICIPDGLPFCEKCGSASDRISAPAAVKGDG